MTSVSFKKTELTLRRPGWVWFNVQKYEMKTMTVKIFLEPRLA